MSIIANIPNWNSQIEWWTFQWLGRCWKAFVTFAWLIKLATTVPCTCPKYRVTFDASVIWCSIGLRRLFGPGGLYWNLVWLFLIGAVLPVGVRQNLSWQEMDSSGKHTSYILQFCWNATCNSYILTMQGILLIGMIFNCFVFRFQKRWWQKYNYVQYVALDAGHTF